ncbi:hypothetical protein WICPIJ_004540 [Wickerhamomyces pijperi]|uniref:A-factor-processing enzyme n=1 Tax=Wickerhamomyces pijperi TaxID=599730 RepID=A0A9P8Q7R7_WICPI|nr:hypothetical protein WICPIJ_004540 [Wickerhamomyces pijperi]
MKLFGRLLKQQSFSNRSIFFPSPCSLSSLYKSGLQLSNLYHFYQRNLSSSSTLPPLAQFSRNMSTGINFLQSNGIEKPDLDDREYKTITLSNGLTALLIHDAKADKAAAALDVNVGAFSDYENLPGLAHFCEHLLFMGTEKYPEENEYSSFLSNHGGHSNAYTAAEDTNYYFEVNQEHLEGALDRFAQFFISPLFDPSCKDREILAVDSENKKNLQNDLWRLYQLDKSTSNPEHPYHKFSTGNKQTLGDIPSSEGVDVRAELLKFYKDSYSANLMKVSVLGRESLETLESWVIEKFSAVPNYSRPVPTFQGQVFTSNELQRIIKAKPVMSKNKISISFNVPDHEKHWDVQSSHYYSHLIGHEGKGSLLDFLKGKGWANGLSAGGHTISVDNAVFGIDVDLTDAGLVHYEEVLKCCFQYLKMLQSDKPQQWIWEELKEVSIMNFRFKQKSSAANTVSKYAKDLQKVGRYIPEQFTLSKTVLRRWDEPLIVEFGEALTIENARVLLVSQSVETDLKEKWYGTEHSISKLSAELISEIKSLPMNDQLHLPKPNPFIPTDFKVTKAKSTTPEASPILLTNEEDFRFWYKQDDQFEVPKAAIQLLLNLPVTVSTPYNAVLTSLFNELFDDSLIDTSYNAELAGLSFSISTGKEGIVVDVTGYSQKASVLLQTVLTEMFQFVPTEERFNVIKERILRNYKNQGYKVPYSQITSVFANLVNECSWDTEDRLAALQNIAYSDLLSFIPLIFKQIYIEGLIHGNFTQEQALDVVKLVQGGVKANSLLKSQKIKSRSYLLPTGRTFRYEKTLPDEKNINSCIQYFIQIDQSGNRESYAYAELLANLIKEPAFDVLRTKEQLGYIVFSGILESRTTFGLRIIIQSERNNAYLESRIVNFLNNFQTTLEELPEDEFNKNKRSLIQKKLESLKNLSQENGRFIKAISNGYYDFTHNEKESAILETITKSQLSKFYQDVILSSESPKLIVNLNALGGTDSETVEGFPTGLQIKDSGSFKSTLFLTPSASPVEEISNFSVKL